MKMYKDKLDKGMVQEYAKNFLNIIFDLERNPNKTENRIIHYTHNDMDGVGCSVIMAMFKRFVMQFRKEVATETFDPRYFSYPLTVWSHYVANPSEIVLPNKLSSRDIIIITDLCVTPEIMEQLKQHGAYFIVDHHIWDEKNVTKNCAIDEGVSATFILNQIITEIIEDVIADVDIKMIAFGLCDSWKSYLEESYCYARNVSLYDTGDFGQLPTDWSPENISNQMKESFYFEDYKYDFNEYIRNVLGELFGECAINRMSATRKNCIQLSMQNKLLNDYVTITTIADADVGNVIAAYIPFSVPSFSLLAQLYLKTHPAVDILISLVNRDGRQSISMRSYRDADENPKKDCQRIAKMLGGGGHKNAAGFPVTKNNTETQLFGKSDTANITLQLNPFNQTYTVTKKSSFIEHPDDIGEDINKVMYYYDKLRDDVVQENAGAQLISCEIKYERDVSQFGGYLVCNAVFSVNKNE
jgi:hypothetical protein